MTTKTFAQITSEMVTYIRNIDSTLDTAAGTLLRDIVIEAPADQMADLYTELDAVKKSASVNYPTSVTDEDMDNLAANYGLTRNGATYATGTIRFYRYDDPGAGTYTITAGTVVSTRGGIGQTVVSFATATTVSITSSSTYDTTNGYYYVDTSITCVASGEIGNVGANAITVMGAVTGINGCFNSSPSAGGADQESNTALAARIVAQFQGNNYGTAGGYDSILRTLGTITEVIVVGPNDTEMTRSTYGGSIDVYFRGDNIAATSESSTYTTGTTYFQFAHQPVKKDTTHTITVTGTKSGVPASFVETTDWVWTPDTGSKKGSSQGLDNITWVVGRTPDNATTTTYSYYYNKNCADGQALFDSDTYHIICADALVREANPVDLYMTLAVLKNSGASSTTVSSAVTTAVYNYVLSLALGADLDVSDLITYISNTVSNVDSVTFSRFNRLGDSSNSSRVSADKTEYFRIQTSSTTYFVITVT